MTQFLCTPFNRFEAGSNTDTCIWLRHVNAKVEGSGQEGKHAGRIAAMLTNKRGSERGIV